MRSRHVFDVFLYMVTKVEKRTKYRSPHYLQKERGQWDWGVGRETRGLILDKYDVYMYDIMTLIILYNEYMPVSKIKITFISFGIKRIHYLYLSW